MDHVDSKFISLLSNRLSKFKRVKAGLYNFRCPICGDSKKNKNKTRGYIYQVKTNTNFKCHNCGASLSFNNFLKDLDPGLHKQYTLEKFKEGHSGKNFRVKEPEFVFQPPKFKETVKLPKCSEDPRSDGYLSARKLDASKFYFAEEFKKYVNSKKKVFESTKYDEPRIIIPLYYKESLVGIQGRSMDFGNPNSVKYITVMFNDDAPKIYGLDNVRTDAPVYVTEGPFDSTFIRNAIAMCGADADVSR